MKSLLTICLVLLPIFAFSQERDGAIAGQAADVGTTAVGLALGAAEANPLGILTLGIKAALISSADSLPEEEKPEAYKTIGAFGWGAAANNICVILGIVAGGLPAALCPIIGLSVGLGVYHD